MNAKVTGSSPVGTMTIILFLLIRAPFKLQPGACISYLFNPFTFILCKSYFSCIEFGHNVAS